MPAKPRLDHRHCGRFGTLVTILVGSLSFLLLTAALSPALASAAPLCYQFALGGTPARPEHVVVTFNILTLPKPYTNQSGSTYFVPDGTVTVQTASTGASGSNTLSQYVRSVHDPKAGQPGRGNFAYITIEIAKDIGSSRIVFTTGFSGLNYGAGAEQPAFPPGGLWVLLAGPPSGSFGGGLFPNAVLPAILPDLKSYLNTLAVIGGQSGFPLGLQWEAPVEAISSNCDPAAAVTGVSPRLLVNSATTSDGQNVILQYSVSGADFSQPVKVNVYRSANPDPSAVAPQNLIGSATLDPSQLKQGKYTTTLLSETLLPPNTALPYVVIVANPDNSVAEDSNSTNSTYFRKYLLGAVVHGYAFSSSSTMAWVNTMAQQLRDVDKFDYVLPYDWTADSTLRPDEITATPGARTVLAHGNDLYTAIVAQAQSLLAKNHHRGDVVDIHLIAHSRGTVVVSQALMQFQPPTQPSDPSLAGSYVEVTFLDPHPANAADDTLMSSGTGLDNGFAFYAIGFQDAVRDPEPVLPQKGVIQAVDLIFQHTPVYRDQCGANTAAASTSLPWSEDQVNLWGQDRVLGADGVPVNHLDLTCAVSPDGVLIGHSEVVAYYEQTLVDSGGVDRQ